MSEPEHIKFILKQIMERLEKQWKGHENEEIPKECIIEVDRT